MCKIPWNSAEFPNSPKKYCYYSVQDMNMVMDMNAYIST
jgi:hypothetical protein